MSVIEFTNACFQDDDGSVSFHGVAFVNLAPLLYPGGITQQEFLLLILFEIKIIFDE